MVTNSEIREQEGAVCVAGVDPGGTTGWVVGDAWEGQFYCTQHGQFPYQEGACAELAAFFVASGVAAVVIEDFVLYAGRSHTGATGSTGLSPVVVTSELRVELRHAGFEGSIAVQMAAQAKGIVTDDRLRRWRLWFPGEPHARDAARHAALYARRLVNPV
jgi:hypothetical protein